MKERTKAVVLSIGYVGGVLILVGLGTGNWWLASAAALAMDGVLSGRSL